ncbi:YbaB/EbfC family nucleoid-associated protein [Metamycoplasma cloacale]|uniref:Nucleoid-associated protein DK849_02500 n=1 Tax=Metamycoplasma cloacale TaxID=92401 RepID=A0A2Z4LMI5_9BACT|nr:YbaB/EbfC family nucleoid-associated protein [Metamycoplasma cloacale]
MNMNEMLKKAKRLQTEMELKEKEIQNKEFLIEKQGISLVITGRRKVKSITINEALIDPDDPELIQDLVMLAINEGIDKVEEAYAELESEYSASGLPF